jgi:hypothetical protein
MKLKNLFIVHSVVALFNGGSLVLAPKLYLSVYGISLSDQAAIFISQLLGAGLLAYCVVAWFARDAEASDARRAIVLGFFITLTIGFIIALLGQLSGVMNALGWVIVGLYFLLALGYGYFQFIKPDTT